MKLHQVLRQKAHTGAVLLRRATQAYRRDGPSAAAALLKVSLIGFLPWRWKRDQKSEFDRMFGVDTSGIVRIASMDIASPNYIHGRYYKASSAERFLGIMDHLDIDSREYTFVDYGSGKGLTLLLASHYSFEKIIGVEFGADLVRIAQANAVRYTNPARQCWNIESICVDAAEFEPPSGPMVAYCYDPFGLPVLRGVLEKLARSYKNCPRPVIFIYHGAPPDSALHEEAAERARLLGSYSFLNQAQSEGTVTIYESSEVRAHVSC